MAAAAAAAVAALPREPPPGASMESAVVVVAILAPTQPEAEALTLVVDETATEVDAEIGVAVAVD